MKCEVKCVHCFGESRKEGKTKYNKQRYKCFKCKKTFVIDIKEQQNERKIRYEKFIKMYLTDKLSTTQIGKELGVSSTIPQRILKKMGLTRDVNTGINTRLANNVGLTHDEFILTIPAFKKYKRKVWYHTNKQEIEKLPNFDKRSLCGVKDGYQLDHKYSILEGFKNDIKPDIIGNIKNLEFIPWKENRNKGSRCSITLEDLHQILL